MSRGILLAQMDGNSDIVSARYINCLLKRMYMYLETS